MVMMQMMMGRTPTRDRTGDVCAGDRHRPGAEGYGLVRDEGRCGGEGHRAVHGTLVLVHVDTHVHRHGHGFCVAVM